MQSGARLEAHIRGVTRDSQIELHSLPIYTTLGGESKPLERQMELAAIVGNKAVERAQASGIEEPVEVFMQPIIY